MPDPRDGGPTRTPTRRMILAGLAAGGLLHPAAAEARQPDGAVGIVVSPDGPAGIVYESETAAPFAPADGWHIGSNTKAMTAALYARLVDEGRCHWGATLAALLPQVPMHADWADVTVEELMAHVAGLDDGPIDGAWLDARRAERTSPRAQRTAFAAELLGRPRTGRRGAYRYANANFVLIGAAIERAVDAGWERAMRDRLFAPLGMAGAGFGAPPREGIWGREPAGGHPAPVDPAGVADNPPVLWPSGGVHLPPGDYARFLAVFLPGGPAYLRPGTLDHLLRPPGAGQDYAGGWSLAGPSDRRADVLTHNGSNSFWFATATLYRPRARGYAAIANQGGGAGEAVVADLIHRLRHPGPRGVRSSRLAERRRGAGAAA